MTKLISFAVKIGTTTVMLLCAVMTAARGTALGNPSRASNVSCPGNCLFCSPTEMLCPGANVTDVLNNRMDFMQVVYLDFSNASLTIIPVELTLMTNCKKLDLSTNNIQTVDELSLENLWSLEELVLSNNSIMDIARINLNTLFYNNKNIRVLNLSNNLFTDLGRDPSTMLYSESLEVLDVSKCRIVSLLGPMVLDGLKKLTYLNLSNNPLARLDGLYSIALKVLNVKDCLLSHLSDTALAGLANLEILDASKNDQLSMNSALQSATLKSLDVSYCAVRTPKLSGTAELRSAFLNNNRIRRLTAYQFANNTKLITLDLSKNNVESVDPLTFHGMSSLLLLDLSSNAITTVPWETSMTAALPSLQMLNLSHNPIGQIGVLESNTLRRLDLGHCQIRSVPDNAFAALDQLTELVLANNPLQALVPGSLNSTRLSLLDLSYCRISHLAASDFANTPNLTDVRLTGNRLVALKNATFAKCAKLKYVYLDDNLWRCDCYSADFAYTALLANRTKPSPAIDRSPRCSSPENATEMLWHAACANGSTYGRDNRKNFSMAVGVILILCVSGLMAICVAVHENMKSQQALRRRQQLEEYDGGSERGGLNGNEYFDVAESVRKLSQLPSYDEAVTLPRPPAKNRNTKRHSCTQTDETAATVTAANSGPRHLRGGYDDDGDDDEDDENGGGGGDNVAAGKYKNRFLVPPGFHVTRL